MWEIWSSSNKHTDFEAALWSETVYFFGALTMLTAKYAVLQLFAYVNNYLSVFFFWNKSTFRDDWYLYQLHIKLAFGKKFVNFVIRTWPILFIPFLNYKIIHIYFAMVCDNSTDRHKHCICIQVPLKRTHHYFVRIQFRTLLCWAVKLSCKTINAISSELVQWLRTQKKDQLCNITCMCYIKFDYLYRWI